jgi:hypothetical protein
VAVQAGVVSNMVVRTELNEHLEVLKKNMLGTRADSPDGINDLMRPPVFVLRIRIATIPKHAFSVKHHPKKSS